VRASGGGEPVVLIHGVPTSSLLWRKVLPELAARGRRGVAFDLPGLGLADRSRAPHHRARKVDLKAMAAIRRLQANPELGEFRIHAALAQLGIHLSPRTCGRILALHRELGAPHPDAAVPHEPQPMPLAAQRRHQFWSVDIRYVEDHDLGTDKPAYAISILENFSRALLASAISPAKTWPRSSSSSARRSRRTGRRRCW